MPILAKRFLGRFGLKAKMTAIFAIGALLVSAVLAVLAYEATRTFLVRQRTNTVLHQSYLNAWSAKGALLTPPVNVPSLLTSLQGPSGSESVLYYRGQWFAPSAALIPGSLPAELRRQVLAGHPSRQSFVLSGQPAMAVGVPLPAVGADFFNVFPLRDLASTLAILRNSLLPAAAVTTLVGALVGRWVSGRLLRPIGQTSQAASQVAHGRLDVRLEPGSDPDLAALARAFNQMTGALQARIERDNRFASTVSHELRTPLTTLRASLAVLRSRRHELSEPAARALDLLEGELRRFHQLVQDLLEMSRIDAGSADVTLEPVRIGELVGHAVVGRERPVPLELAEPAAGAVVMADKRRLERVLANLLDNAEVHGGGVRRLAVEGGDGRVRIAVEDAGPGVPAEEQSRIFEPFARGTAARGRQTDGSGLGLALVEEHLQLLGGRAWVEDRDGGGARFVAELPASNP